MTPAELKARSRAAGRRAYELSAEAVRDLAAVRARDGDETDVAVLERLLSAAVGR